MKRARLTLAFLVLLTATPSYGKAGPCEELTTACDLALKAQDDLIVGLKDALKQSRQQTDRAIENSKAEKAPFLEGLLVPLVLGFATGALIGIAVK